MNCVALRVSTHQENLVQCLQKMMKMIFLLMERQVEMKLRKGEFESLIYHYFTAARSRPLPLRSGRVGHGFLKQ